jgi:hypothetical protein
MYSFRGDGPKAMLTALDEKENNICILICILFEDVGRKLRLRPKA